MASFNATITNTINVFGASPPNLWGTLVWGVDNWGASEDLAWSFEKGLFEAVSLNDALSKTVVLNPFTNTLTLSTALDVTRSIGIWDYVFTRPTADGTQSVYDEAIKVGEGSVSWTKQSDGSTEWSKT